MDPELELEGSSKAFISLLGAKGCQFESRLGTSGKKLLNLVKH